MILYHGSVVQILAFFNKSIISWVLFEQNLKVRAQFLNRQWKKYSRLRRLELCKLKDLTGFCSPEQVRKFPPRISKKSTISLIWLGRQRACRPLEWVEYRQPQCRVSGSLWCPNRRFQVDLPECWKQTTKCSGKAKHGGGYLVLRVGFFGPLEKLRAE